MKRIFSRVLTFFLLIGFIHETSAGVEPVNVRLNSSEIIVSNGFAVSDNKYYTPGGPDLSGQATIVSSDAQIVLGIDHRITNNTYTNFTFKVLVEIKAYDKQFNPIPTPQLVSLEVVYSKSNGFKFKDRDAYVIKDAHKVTTVIKSIVYTDANGHAIPNPSSNIPTILFMEGEIVTTRYYTAGPVWAQLQGFTSTEIVMTPIPSVNPYEIEVNWPHKLACEEYELEWIFVNDYFTSASNIEYSFRNNATRISTTENYYRIPLIYEKGWLLCRLRSKGRDVTNLQATLTTDWSISCSNSPCETGLVSNYANAYHITTPHDDAKNWVYEASFAEEGKRKESVKYFDGGFLSRQFVTKQNTNNHTIIGETMYDYQGRPAVTMLPGVFNAPDIKFRSGFNLKTTGLVFGKQHFDIDQGGTCALAAPSVLVNSSGSSNYYSTNNPDKDEQQAYVPDASGYPYSQIEYTPDKTGRPRRLGGVGSSHQLGSGHETKYYYGQPEQDELDMLFAAEAGLAYHYKKNTVVDANGQISTSYVDMAGRTVATSLTGDAPTNLDAVPAANQTIKSRYINSSANTPNPNVEVGDNSILFTKEITVTKPGNYTFDYSLEREFYSSVCSGAQMCYNCVYDLTIDVLDECGNTVLTNPFTHVIGTIDSIAFNCPNPKLVFPATAGISPLTVNLAQIGSYTIVKKLTVNEVTTNLYTDVYIRKNPCLKTLQNFETDAMAEVDLSGCHTDCSDCLNSLGLFSDHNDLAKATPGNSSYDPNYVYMTQTQYDYAKAECEEACKPISECDVLYQMMMGDVSPYGQYAQFNITSTGAYDASTFPLSVFNTANLLPRSLNVSFAPFYCTPSGGSNPGNFRFPKMTTSSGVVNEYQDEDGTRTKIYLDEVSPGVFVPDYDNTVLTSGPPFDNLKNKYYVYPENLKNLKDFVEAYSQHPNWAKSMIEYHPEWGYYGLCNKLTDPNYAQKNSRTSEEFDVLLQNTNTYDDAVTEGLINPSNLSDPDDLFNQDPFFFNTMNGNTPLGQNFSANTNFQNNILANYKNSGKTLKQCATQVARCNNVFYGSTSACTGNGFGDASYFTGSSQDALEIRDSEWRIYRDMYLGEKQKLTKNIVNKIAKGSFTSFVPNDDGFYNGPIGIGSEYYNPYLHDMVVIGPYWAFWWWTGWNPFGSTPTFPSFINQLIDPRCYGYGLFDPGQPSYHGVWNYYTNKTKRYLTADDILPPPVNVNSISGSSSGAIANYAEYNNYQMTGQCPATLRFQGFLNQLVESFKLHTSTNYPLVLNDFFTKEMYNTLDPNGASSNSYQLFSYLPVINGNALTGNFYNSVGQQNACNFSLIQTSGQVFTATDWQKIKYFTDITFISNLPAGTSNFRIKAFFDHDLDPLTANLEVNFKGSTRFALSGCSFADVCSPSQTASELLALLNMLLTSPGSPNALANTSAINLSASPYTSVLTPKLKLPFGTSGNLNWAATGTPGSALTANLYNASNQVSSAFSFNFAQLISAGYSYNNIQFFSSIAPDASSPNKFVLQAYVGISNGSPVFLPIDVTITPPGSSPLYNLGKCGVPPNMNCRTSQNLALEDMQTLLNELITPANQLQSSTPVSLLPYQGFTHVLESFLAPGNNSTWNYVNTVGSAGSVSLVATIGTGASACTIKMSSPEANYNSAHLFTNISGFYGVKADNSQLGVGGYPNTFLIIATLANNSDTMMIRVTTSCFQFKDCFDCNSKPIYISETFDSYTGGATPQPSILSPDFTCVSGSSGCIPSTMKYNILNETILSSPCTYAIPGVTGSVGMLTNKDTTGFLNKNYMHLSVNPFPLSAVYSAWQYSNGSNNLVNVEPYTDYEFSVLYRKNYNENAGPVLYINGINIATEDYTKPYPVGAWVKIKGVWNSLSTTTADIRVLLVNWANSQISNAYYVDLDEIVFRSKPCSRVNEINKEPADSIPTWEPCDTMLTAIGMANALSAYEGYVADEKAKFRKNYLSKCLSAFEQFGVQYTDRQHHYTLYYYDQAGNLVKTVPPEGVELIDLSATFPNTTITYRDAIRNDRANNTREVYTKHRLATTYEYNSLNNLIRQSVPDHDIGNNWSLTNTVNGINPTLPNNVVANSIEFNGANGYLVGTDGTSNTNNGVIYTTTDGGITWAPASNVGFNTLNKIVDAGSGFIYAVSDGGALIKSSNGGTSWSVINLPGTSAKINALHFFSSNSGIVVGNNGVIFQTSNGGSSWTQQTNVVSTAVDLLDIQFTNANFGYIVGSGGTLLYTSNGGSTWSAPSIALNANLVLTSCQFYPPQVISTFNVINGFVTGYDKINNEGKTVYITNLNSSPYVSGSSPLNTVNYSGVIFNNGAQPAKVLNSLSIADPNSTTGNTDDYVLTAGKSGEIYRITYSSALLSWQGVLQSVPSGYSGEVSQIVYPKSTTINDAFACVKNGDILKFNGTSWSQLPGFTNTTPLNSIYFTQPYTAGVTDVYVAGNGGVVYKSTNGSSSFANVTQMSFPELKDVGIAKDNSGIVIAVGKSGTVLRSANNGVSWTALSSSTSSDLNAVWVFSNANAIIGGQSGIIGSVSNGIVGSTYSYLSNTINDIYFSSANQGYLVGNGGMLYTTANSGGSWTNNSSNTVNSLKSIHSYGNTVIAVGVGGTIVRSQNNGAFTNISQAATTVDLNKVRVMDNQRMYAFGQNSTIVKSLNGGSNWTLLNQVTSGNAFNSVAFTGQGEALVASGGTESLLQFIDDPANNSASFIYDRLGRLVISQNIEQAKKQATPAHSYTKYDVLGRVYEVGEVASSLSPSQLINYNGLINESTFTSWVNSGLRTEVSTVIYDFPVTSMMQQKNLRKRVSASYLDNNGNLNDGYESATFYSYDIHGNVDVHLEDNPGLAGQGILQRFKKTDYEYDLISGKVNQVKYQASKPDAFYHKYHYDADNRIISVYTSRNNLNWEQDAKYYYYKHGPMARVELGDEKVQGVDYAYTISGWIKGVNSSTMKEKRDIGKDGEQTVTSGPLLYKSTQPKLHKYVSRDAFGYSLNYFNADYSPISGIGSPNKYDAANRFDASISSIGFYSSLNAQLFNGNISAMTSAIPMYNTNGNVDGDPVLTTYVYDQLNRIKDANNYYSTSSVLANNTWPSASSTLAWKNSFTYDANGNILTQVRRDNLTNLIDQQTYRYEQDAAGKLVRNRLYHVNDASASNLALDDVDDQGTFTPASAGNINTSNNYGYDRIGNLKRDNSEQIANIAWTVQGKVKSISRTAGSSKPDLEFFYNSSGNRITKIVKPRPGGVLSPSTAWIHTYYRRDAQGNVLAVYEEDKANNTYKLVEQTLYGASRLGTNTGTLYKNLPNTMVAQSKQAHEKGYKAYELSNHLGNVMVTVSDRRTAKDDNSDNLTDRFEAEVLNFAGYYPFGSPMPGRQFNNGSYRYGFNGKENDNEVKGTGNQQDYGMRIYDPRLGRFLSVDPLTQVYPFYSPYQFAGNKPIKYIDVDGLEEGEKKMGKGAVFTTEKIKSSIGVPQSPSGVNFSDPEETQKFIEENDRRSKNLSNNQQIVDVLNETIGGIVMMPLDAVGDAASAAYYAYKGDWFNAGLSGAAIFIPAVSGSMLRMGGPLIKGSIKVMENGKEVAKDAFKFGNYGYKGTKQYKAVVDAVKKGGNFVASSEEEAKEILGAAFKDLPLEEAHKQSKYGYRVEDVPLTDQSGRASGHTGKHINYYDKANGVEGTITIEPPKGN